MLNVRKLKSSQLDSAVLAMAIGDGGLYRGPNSINYYLAMEHCEKQLDYVNWKKKILDQIGNIETKLTKNNRGYYRLQTPSKIYFTKKHKILYTDGKKSINKLLLSKLSDLALAILYMDDGSFDQLHKVCKLATYSFSLDEHKQLQKWFLDRHNLKVSIITENRKNNKIIYCLKFGKKESQDFLEIVKPYVAQLECMHYKLGILINASLAEEKSSVFGSANEATD